MRVRPRLDRLTFKPRLPRWTLRLRLTVLYGGLFLVAGAGLLAITYVLVRHATAGGTTFFGSRVDTIVGPGALNPPDGTIGVVIGMSPQQAAVQAQQVKAVVLHQHAAVLHQLVVQSGIALGLMAVVSMVLGWIVAGRALRPLRTITSTARRISATNLHERLALDRPDDELKELGDTFDQLLGRLESSFEAQRHFVANASHELRSPLARQRTVAQVALADPDATVESLRAAHERVLASGEQQARLIDALLTLARGQGGLVRREPFDLATVAEQVLLHRQAEAEQRGLQIEVALGTARVAGDPRLVERLVANLVDNALRHNIDHGHLEVTSRTTDGYAILSVTNTGPVVPPSSVDRLLQPFQRLGEDRTGHGEGLGLGLSIVKAIADAHAATVVVQPQHGGGLQVDVSFPTRTL